MYIKGKTYLSRRGGQGGWQTVMQNAFSYGFSQQRFLSPCGPQGLYLNEKIPWVQVCQSFSSEVHKGGQHSLVSTSQVYPEKAGPPAPRPSLRTQVNNHIRSHQVTALSWTDHTLHG